jgi:hypothetical protein
MPKPFSSKQKKIQLQEKRERKKTHEGADSDSNDSAGTEDPRPVHGPIPVAKLNQQPIRRGNRNQPKVNQEYDANRYRLYFYRESKVLATD